MIDRARRPRRIPLTILFGGLLIGALLDPAPRVWAADPLETLAGPPSSRFT